MIRLFVAIDIPDNIKNYIQGMARAIPRARSVPPDQLHLTLKFIGEVESSVLLDVRDALGRINTPSFSLQLNGVGTFPPRGTPHVLWIGTKNRENEEHLFTLRKQIEKALFAADIAKEKKKFSPHITLARLNNSPIKALQNFLAGNALLQSPWFEVKSFTLYSSQLTPKGAIHTVEERYRLR